MNAMTFWKIAGIVTFLKALLIPSYRSTDFEVHRNWLAITHSLPLSRWYYEATSEWTLDYPPFFAYFEMILSQIAQFFDPKMLVVSNLNYASTKTIIFQRLSVILTDFVYIYAVKKYCESCIFAQPVKAASGGHTSPRFILTLIMLLNFGLLLVDHIHFQYNGMLFGILLLSITRIFQGRVMEGSLLFATLLSFKHIFLYIAPAYGIYLLRWYCLYNGKDHSLSLSMVSIRRLFLLAFVVLSTIGIAFGPFVLLGQMPQVLSRLFPFKRGLCHAYWAPNFWALYNVADKLLAQVAVKYGFSVAKTSASMTGGLVQESAHTFLPSVPPIATLILTLLAIMPAVLNVWRRPTGSRGFLRCLILCAYAAFLFGWHVHEKAILIVLVPLGLLSVEKQNDGATFFFLSAVGGYSLFPLIFTAPETPIVYCLYLLYMLVLAACLHAQFPTLTFRWYNPLPLLHPLETYYILGLGAVETLRCMLTYTDPLPGPLGPPLAPLGSLGKRYPFLPLMLVSVYCALGVVWAWLRLYRAVLTAPSLVGSGAERGDEGDGVEGLVEEMTDMKEVPSVGVSVGGKGKGGKGKKKKNQ